MIEVEKKFQPTEEQIKKLVNDSEFQGEEIIHDIYYDYKDYRLLRNDIRLRNRNGGFELKIGKSSGVAEEIENEKEIAQYFGTENLTLFIRDNLIEIINYSAQCKQYKKDDFFITIDKMNFGYDISEIEILVENEQDIPEAQEKIDNFAKRYGWETKSINSKRQEYFRIVKPEVYKILYPN